MSELFIIKNKNNSKNEKEKNKKILTLSIGGFKKIKVNQKLNNKVEIKKEKYSNNKIIKLLYNKKGDNIIKVLDSRFGLANYKKFRIIFKNKISENINFINGKESNNAKIKIYIKFIETIRDISFMFNKCSLLESLKYMPKLNNITNISCLFYGCSSLKII